MDFFPPSLLPIYEPLEVGAEWSDHFRFFGLMPDGDSDILNHYWNTMNDHHIASGWVESPILPNFDDHRQTFIQTNGEPILTAIFGDLWEANAYVRDSLSEADQKKIVDGLRRLKNGDMPPADWFPYPIYILMSCSTCC